MTKILVTGASGQLASEIKVIANDYPQFEFVFTKRDQLPLHITEYIVEALTRINPNIIINTGAYTAVDRAESEKDLAEAVNHLAVAEMAKWAEKNRARIIHISTDYVFDGSSRLPINELEATAPINWYGETKLRGEKALLHYHSNGIIIRTAWVYSEFASNFVKTMLRLMREKDAITVVNDQFGAPTYAMDLAKAIMSIIVSTTWHPGVYHYSNTGEISWFEFAQAIQEFSGLNCQVNAVASDQFPTVAKRPIYSLLDTTKIQQTYGIGIPFWKDSLLKVVRERLTDKNQKI
ncbi:dTDP-4-dehydrorhamnose reductase [Gelidibacter sp. F2691]|nr:dTDP-4-dehydrorhamnose reductase [Gelidibacter sp. F2691]